MEDFIERLHRLKIVQFLPGRHKGLYLKSNHSAKDLHLITCINVIFSYRFSDLYNLM